MKPYFKLRTYKDSEDLQQIQLYYYHNGKQLLLDTTVKTMALYWDDDKQKITSRAAEIKQKPNELNDTLTEKLNKINSVIQDYKHKNSGLAPDIDHVRNEFYLERTKILEANDVKADLFDWNQKKKTKVKLSGWKIYNTLYNDLLDFHPEPLFYRNLTLRFFNELRSYWLEQDPPIQNSTIIKRFRCFKIFLYDKQNSGENEFIWFVKFKLELSGVKDPEIIIPTPEEVAILQDFPISDSRLDDARDLYCIGCSSGLRFSDVVGLKPRNIVNEEIKLTTQKTKQSLTIPLNDVSKMFLEKQFSKYRRVKDISNQKLNEALRGTIDPKHPEELPKGGLFRMISEKHPEHPFSREVKYLQQFGNEDPKENWVPKWSILSFHSSRKYFISYLVNVAKIDIGNVMAWSGHTNIQTVRAYLEKGQKQKDVMQGAFKRK